MWVDSDLVLSDAQAITGSTSATPSTNYIDLNATGRSIRNDAKIVVMVNTTCDSTEEDSTLTVTLLTDEDEAFGSATTLYATGAIAEATLAAGYKILEFDLSDFSDRLERYLGLQYQVGTHNLTAGKLDAYIVIDRQSA